METLDLKGLKCPLPILKAKKKLAILNSGDELCVLTTDASAEKDFTQFCAQTGHRLIRSYLLEPGLWEIIIRHK